MLPTFQDSPSRQFSQQNPAWGWGWPCCCSGGTVTGEHGLLFGGLGAGTAGVLGDLWSYDDTGDTWTAKTAHTARSRHFAAKSASDLTIWSSGFPLTPAATGLAVQQYVPSTDTWTEISAIPTVRDGDTCATVSTGHVRFGGDATGGGSNTVRVDLLSGIWSVDQPLPSSRSYQCQSYVINGDAYVVGGFTGAGLSTKVNTNLRFHPTGTGSWTTQTALVNERVIGSGASVPGVGTSSIFGFIIGGTAATGTAIGSITDETDEYDSTADAWTVVSAMPAVRQDANAFVLNNIIYNVCGQQSGGIPTTVTNFAYDSSGDSWTTKSAFTGQSRKEVACTAA